MGSTSGHNFFFFFFFKNLASSVLTYHGQLSSCTISEKTNDPILRKLSDGQTNGWTDGRTDRRMDRRRDEQTNKSDFTGHSPTNAERPKSEKTDESILSNACMYICTNGNTYGETDRQTDQ